MGLILAIFSWVISIVRYDGMEARRVHHHGQWMIGNRRRGKGASPVHISRPTASKSLLFGIDEIVLWSATGMRLQHLSHALFFPPSTSLASESNPSARVVPRASRLLSVTEQKKTRSE